MNFENHLPGEGEADHRFNPEQVEKLFEPSRVAELEPDQLVEKLQLQPGDRVLDLGTGAGLFLQPLRRKVGERGEVIGVDLSEEMLAAARSQWLQQPPANLTLQRNDPGEIPLATGSVDAVLAVCLLHELAEPEATLKEVRRVLKSSGKVVALDWRDVEREEGPPLDHRLSAQEASKIFPEAGLPEPEVETWSDNYYLLVSGGLEQDCFK